MLQSLRPLLLCPVCRNPRQDLRATILRSTKEAIVDGWLVCPACSSVFPIVDRLLELVPPALVEPSSVHALRDRYQLDPEQENLFRLDLWEACSVDRYDVQLKQRSHFDECAISEAQDWGAYAAMPFWRAVDEWTFARWRQTTLAGSLFLDVGCADGRSAFPYADRHVIVGFDISRRMIRRGIEEAEKRGLGGRCTFFVGDGTVLPFKDGTFPYVQTYGVLHHLPAPANAVREIQRVLEPGGIHFGSENNATVLRAAFDALMRICPIWREEAGEEPLISRDMLETWTRGLAVEITSETIVFLPPHAFNLLSRRWAGWLLNVTNRFGSGIPGLRANGGLLVFRITRREGSHPDSEPRRVSATASRNDS